MTSIVRAPAVKVWAALVLLTCGSFWLGVDHGLGTARGALAVILVIALGKAWLVGRYFMELRHAPRWLQGVVDTWLLVTGGVVIGMYVAL
jgi:hypothetical protein